MPKKKKAKKVKILKKKKVSKVKPGIKTVEKKTVSVGADENPAKKKTKKQPTETRIEN